MPKNTGQELNVAILQALHASSRSWSLYFLLRERGYEVSAPTIGRRLRELERKNLLGKVTREGRAIKPSGVRMLQKAAKDHQARSSAEEVLKLLRSNRLQDIIDLLNVRRIIEGESARLAAVNASPKTIAKLEESVGKQKNSLKGGGLAVEEDVRFHETLAKASGNKFLAYSVHLLRSHERLNYAVIAIRAKVGVSLAVDHEQIISAIREHNPAAAEMLMQRHVTGLIAEVEQYWRETFRRRSGSRREAGEEALAVNSAAVLPRGKLAGDYTQMRKGPNGSDHAFRRM